jgi:hypothetical protein
MTSARDYRLASRRTSMFDDDRDGVTAMANEPVYRGHEFEVLKACYVEQVANLRNLNDYDLRVLAGFLTVQLGLASWFALHPPNNLLSIIIIIVINLVVTLACKKMLEGARLRRDDAGAAIKTINEAFGLYACGVYLDKAIAKKRPAANPRWLYAACWLGFGATVAALILPKLAWWFAWWLPDWLVAAQKTVCV